MKKYLSRIYLCVIFGILYIPIVTLVLFSFNETESTAKFAGFSFEWYIKLFNDDTAFIALRNTLILAVCSAILSTISGTAAAEGLHRLRTRWLKKSIETALRKLKIKKVIKK